MLCVISKLISTLPTQYYQYHVHINTSIVKTAAVKTMGNRVAKNKNSIGRDDLKFLNETSGISREDRLRGLFMLYDVNNDGVITIQEMVQVITSIFSLHRESDIITPAEDTAYAIFARMDVDQDGTISEEEFVNCCLDDKTIFEMLANIDK